MTLEEARMLFPEGSKVAWEDGDGKWWLEVVSIILEGNLYSGGYPRVYFVSGDSAWMPVNLVKLVTKAGSKHLVRRTGSLL